MRRPEHLICGCGAALPVVTHRGEGQRVLGFRRGDAHIGYRRRWPRIRPVVTVVPVVLMPVPRFTVAGASVSSGRPQVHVALTSHEGRVAVTAAEHVADSRGERRETPGPHGESRRRTAGDAVER